MFSQVSFADLAFAGIVPLLYASRHNPGADEAASELSGNFQPTERPEVTPHPPHPPTQAMYMGY